MTDTREPTPSCPQAARPPRDNVTRPSRKQLGRRERYGENWLHQLEKLPPGVLREAVRRLTYGQEAQEVATWIVNLPDRGGLLQHLGFHSLRRMLGYLRYRMTGLDQLRAWRERKLRELAKQLQQQQKQQANVAMIDRARKEPAGPEPPALTISRTERIREMTRSLGTYLKDTSTAELYRANIAMGFERWLTEEMTRIQGGGRGRDHQCGFQRARQSQ